MVCLCFCWEANATLLFANRIDLILSADKAEINRFLRRPFRRSSKNRDATRHLVHCIGGVWLLTTILVKYPSVCRPIFRKNELSYRYIFYTTSLAVLKNVNGSKTHLISHSKRQGIEGKSVKYIYRLS